MANFYSSYYLVIKILSLRIFHVCVFMSCFSYISRTRRSTNGASTLPLPRVCTLSKRVWIVAEHELQGGGAAPQAQAHWSVQIPHQCSFALNWSFKPNIITFSCAPHNVTPPRSASGMQKVLPTGSWFSSLTTLPPWLSLCFNWAIDTETRAWNSTIVRFRLCSWWQWSWKTLC